MKCFNCGYKLPSNNIKECPLCGMKFSISCHSCEWPNPLYAKFCLNCGAKINVAMQNSIENFNILSENRKNVAVMFADVSGFTSLAEKLDPEEVREIINDTFNYITKPVYELEGTIDKYIGDCVMVLFGAKNSHSDDSKRAVICGMEMLKLIKEFSEERLSSKGLKLDLSIGINYGLVVTGSVGNYFDKDYTVMGDVVNTAQRLQTIAEKGTILVSESIYLETNDAIEYSKTQEISVKNKEKPIKSFKPLGLIGESKLKQLPLIDREQELNLLKSSISSFSQQFVTVIGEAGVGKTSLVKQFIANYPDSIKKIWISCNSTYQNRVYYVISNLILSIMNLRNDDNSRVKLNRLRSFIDYILKDYDFEDEEIEKNINFLSLIIGLEREQEFQNILNSMEYDDLQREIINQLSIFIKYSLQRHQYIIVIDETQWADKGSINLIIKAMEKLPELKSLFIFITRYDIDDIQIANKGYTMRLENLTQSGVKTFTASLLQCELIDEELLNLVNKYTNGNPLYVKEFITAIKRMNKIYYRGDKAYVKKGEFSSLPKTIEGLILANLQELDENTLEFLQVASVMGKDFNFQWVNSIIGKKVDDSILKLPLKLNIINLKTIINSAEVMDKIYSFNQDITRDVIYESILNKTKQEYHKQIGEFIEINYLNNLENYYELLCLHYELAGVNKKAEEYHYKTAVKYKNNFNYHNSLEYYLKYLSMVNLNDNRNSKNILNSLIAIGDIYHIMSDYNQALVYFNKAINLTSSTEDIYSIEIMIANVYKEMGKYTEALNILEKIGQKARQGSNVFGKLLQLKSNILRIIGSNDALEFAKKSEEILLRTKDYEYLPDTMNQIAILYFTKGDMDNSLYYLNKANQYAEKTNNLKSILQISGNLGIIYYSVGMTSMALEYFNRSVNIAKQISSIFDLIKSNINLGILYLEKGLFNKSEFLFTEALDQIHQISSTHQMCLTLLNFGDLMYEKGNFKESLDYYNKAFDLAKKQGLHMEEGIYYLGIAKLNLKHKVEEPDNITKILDQAYNLFTASNEISYLSDYNRYKSIYFLNEDNLRDALEFSKKAIAIANDANNDMKRLKAIRLQGIIMAKMGDIHGAIDLFDKSINLSEQLESDYETAKGYYRKYLAMKSLNSLEAEESLILAKKAIDKVDECRWVKIIKDHLNADLLTYF